MIILKTVTVVGANGTMGANVSAIFASFGNATVYMVARDKEKSKKAAIKAGKSVKADSIVTHLIPVDYSNLDECVKNSDLVFESAAENLNLKILQELQMQPDLAYDPQKKLTKTEAANSMLENSDFLPLFYRKD